jgi:3-oxoadipate enol-lactonase
MSVETTVQLAFESHGNGIPLILLHGYPLNRTIWLDIIPWIKDIAQILLVDLRGLGESPSPEGHYLMELMAADVAALMDRLGIQKAIIAGHSMGGYAALAFSKNFPERLLGLGLIATQAAADSPERFEARMATIEDIKLKGTRVVSESIPERLTSNRELDSRLKEIMSTVTKVGLIGTLQGIAARSDARAWLPEIKVPTLVLSGGADVINAREKSQEMASALPRGWWVELLRCGHMPMLEDTASTGIALRSLVCTVQAVDTNR